MTKINRRRPRFTFWETMAKSADKGGDVRSICVAVAPTDVILKWKGRRRKFRFPWTKLIDLAVKAEAEAEVRRKNEERLKQGKAPRRVSVRRGVIRGIR